MNQPAPVAIITGAGRGIGRATAIELARLGYRLSLAARNVESLSETARLAGRSDNGLICRTDVTDPEQVERLVRPTVDRVGGIDPVVNNARLAPGRSIPET